MSKPRSINKQKFKLGEDTIIRYQDEDDLEKILKGKVINATKACITLLTKINGSKDINFINILEVM